MKVSSIRWGIIWIGIGFFFLAINFRVLDSLVFPRLFSLWPVLLIAIGVELIFRRTKLYFLALLSPLLIAAAFILAATHGGRYTWNINEFLRDWSWRYEGEKVFEEEILLDSVIDTVDIELDLGLAEFEIMPVSSKAFFAKSVYYKRSPILSHSTEDAVEYIAFENLDSPLSSILGIRRTKPRATFRIVDDLPIKINMVTEIDRPDIDFSDLHVILLELYLRSNEATIRIGDLADSVELEISGRTKELEIIVPAGFGLDIIANRQELDDILHGKSLEAYADGFHSVGFEDAAKWVRVALDARVKSVLVNSE